MLNLKSKLLSLYGLWSAFRLLCVLLIVASSAEAGWLYKQKVVLDNSGLAASLTNYCTKVKLTSATFNFAHNRSDGKGIKFMNYAETDTVSFGFGMWDSTNGLAYLYPVKSLGSAAKDSVWLYYGNPAATDYSNPNACIWFDNFNTDFAVTQISNPHDFNAIVKDTVNASIAEAQAANVANMKEPGNIIHDLNDGKYRLLIPAGVAENLDESLHVATKISLDSMNSWSLNLTASTGFHAQDPYIIQKTNDSSYIGLSEAPQGCATIAATKASLLTVITVVDTFASPTTDALESWGALGSGSPAIYTPAGWVWGDTIWVALESTGAIDCQNKCITSFWTLDLVTKNFIDIIIEGTGSTSDWYETAIAPDQFVAYHDTLWLFFHAQNTVGADTVRCGILWSTNTANIRGPWTLDSRSPISMHTTLMPFEKRAGEFVCVIEPVENGSPSDATTGITIGRLVNYDSTRINNSSKWTAKRSGLIPNYAWGGVTKLLTPTIYADDGVLHLWGDPQYTNMGGLISARDTVTTGYVIEIYEREINNQSATTFNIMTSVGNGTYCDVTDQTVFDTPYQVMQQLGYGRYQAALTTNRTYRNANTSGNGTNLGGGNWTSVIAQHLAPWRLWQFAQITQGADSVEWLVDDSLITRFADSTYIAAEKFVSINQGEQLSSGNGLGGDRQIDFICVRQRVRPDPTFTLGTETDIPQPVENTKTWGNSFRADWRN